MKSIFYAICILITLFSLTSADVPSIILLTPEEGSIRDAPTEQHKSLILNNGPDIKVIQPENGTEHKSPVPIFVQFVPRNGKEVDLTKLKVECLKIITIDLTPRVLPYTTKERIKIDNAELPSGKHKIRVSIGDLDGGMTQKVFEVKII